MSEDSAGKKMTVWHIFMGGNAREMQCRRSSEAHGTGSGSVIQAASLAAHAWCSLPCHGRPHHGPRCGCPLDRGQQKARRLATSLQNRVVVLSQVGQAKCSARLPALERASPALRMDVPAATGTSLPQRGGSHVPRLGKRPRVHPKAEYKSVYSGQAPCTMANGCGSHLNPLARSENRSGPLQATQRDTAQVVVSSGSAAAAIVSCPPRVIRSVRCC